MDLSELLKVAEAAVDRGRVVTDSREPGELTFKGDRDMASEVDFAVEREVRAFLERETPEIGVLGEEEGGATDGTRWVLDPIDGTVNFIHGVPLWAISLGLIHEGRAVAGVIDHPALGTRYAAAEGLGATCNGKPIRGSECTEPHRRIGCRGRLCGRAGRRAAERGTVRTHPAPVPRGCSASA